jgi:hypothetical protein
MLGREVSTLVSQVVPAGLNRVQWKADRVASGLYLCQVEAGSYKQVIKLVLMK